MSFFGELRRRNVFRVGAAYAVVMWLLIQIVSDVFPLLNLPEWAAVFVTVVLIVGFPITLIMAWAFEMTPEGVKAAADVQPNGSVTPAMGQRLNYLLLGLVALAIAFLVTAGADSFPTPVRRSAVETSADAGAGPHAIRLRLDVFPDRYLSGGLPIEEDAFGLQRPSRPSLALSPDGRYVVYAASNGETTQLYRRPLDQQQATPIPGTEGGSQPFFSPDSRSVGFVVGTELKRVPIEDGEVRTIATSGPSFAAGGASWTEDDTILVPGSEGIYELPANGGNLVQLTQVARSAGELAHEYPQMLPGKRGLLFNVVNQSSVPSDWAVVVETLDGSKRRLVVEGGSYPRYVPSGHIVFARHGAMLAVPFDASRLSVNGAPVVVVEDVMHGEGGRNSELNFGTAQFSVSNTGSLAYVPGGIYPEEPNSLIWVNRTGEVEPLPLPSHRHLWPRFSPDGTRLVYATGGFGDTQLWVYDIELEVSIALTSTGENFEPVWSPDGTRLAFSRLGEDGGLFWVAADGSGAPEPIHEGVRGDPSSWSTDNVLAFVSRAGPEEPRGIWTLLMDGESEPEPFLESESDWLYPDLSPDGKWIAYTSAETGRDEVYVRPFPAGAPVQRISSDGGEAPLWSRDGRQLFYRMFDKETDTEKFMVVDVVTEPAFARSAPRLLFEGAYDTTTPVRSYDISPDDQRFVIRTSSGIEVEPQPVTSINIALNWFEELKRLAPAAQ